ncbi:MAG TPA: response regulator transcription factor [Egibacteraceae bacterium]|nr:response regulator transcription factor [Egibacteraceae bacterium]
MALSVFLVDDHRLFRSGIRAELAGRLHIVGEAGTVDEAVEGIVRLDPTVVLLDVHLPDGGGPAVLARCRAAGYGGQFLALSASDDPKDVVEVIRAGARGYVTKTVDAAELVDAVRRVAGGDAVFSPKLAGFVLDAFSSIPAGQVDADLARLSPREREVLQLVARGYTYREIAERLVLSVKTIESHVSAALRKLQLSNRRDLARWAGERGID